MKIYTYNGKSYESEGEVRQAIWQNERKVFGSFSAVSADVTIEEREDKAPQDDLSEQARAKRDSLLYASDYYLMSDYPSTEEGLAAVKAYRQALRDVTKQDGFPDQINWPELPSVLSK